jgi:hypothetical protein
MEAVEIKSWVKPHLRARLLEEAAAREPKETQGLTPTTVAPAPATPAAAVAAGMTLVPGDRVRLKKPQDPHTGPGWNGFMDKYDGQVVTVTAGTGFFKIQPSWFEADGDWTYCTSWVVEKL